MGERHSPKFGECENCGCKTMLEWFTLDKEKGPQYICRFCLLPDEVLRVEDFIYQSGSLADAEIWASSGTHFTKSRPIEHGCKTKKRK